MSQPRKNLGPFEATGWHRSNNVFAHMKKLPELIPLIGTFTMACVGAGVYCVYCMVQKPDVWVLNRKGLNTPPWEKAPIDYNVNAKELLFGRNKHSRDETLEKLRKEIGDFKL